jgi:catechol 2,3-dioxygenase-like lactoylglutathione lyase family enzyme
MIKAMIRHTLRVADMERSLQFYCGIAGLEKVKEIRGADGTITEACLHAGKGQQVVLVAGGVIVPENRYAPDLTGYHHFCFGTDDIRELAERFHANGLMNSGEPGHGKDLNYNCWIHDPDGNAVEFVQIHPDSPHARSSRKGEERIC